MKEIIRINQLAGTITEDQAKKIMEILNKDQNFEKTHKYLKIIPQDFKSEDFFLRTPDDNGEFFKHKEKVKILSLNLPKDGRSNIAVIKTDDGKTMKLSHTSLYDIARPK